MAHDDISFGFALTPEEAEALLDDLATEGSQFRQDLQADPLKALRARGIAIAPHDIPETIDLLPANEVASVLGRSRRDDGGYDGDDFRPFPWHPFLAVAIMWRWHPFGGSSES